MSQKGTRKSVVSEEKDKSQTDSPAKDLKKKMAAGGEKEKQAAEKSTEKTDRHTEKEKQTEKDKLVDKKIEKVATEKVPEKKVEKVPEKRAEKATEKKTEKPVENKVEKAAEKKVEKVVEKNEKKPECSAEKKDDSKEAGKPEKPETKKQGTKTNGESNGDHNGTASAEDDDDVELVIDEAEIFPELAYDDTSDPEFEPDSALGRSITRRSQAKTTRTPETPRPASGRRSDIEHSKDSKVLKLKEDAPPSTDRKLRSSDSPKPDQRREKRGEGENGEKAEVQVVVEIEGDEEPRKTDTNFSKSRVKVSPYRRSLRAADQTTSSVQANYTGNNTTMEMDITETSSMVDDSLDDSYLSGLRSIRGRRSYKPLKEMSLRNLAANRSARSTASASELPKPTGTVVGRKRKPDADGGVELATEAEETSSGKRPRLLQRLFRPAPSDQIVGINTDLPLSAPVAADPETITLKPSPLDPSPPQTGRDGKRCVLM